MSQPAVSETRRRNRDDGQAVPLIVGVVAVMAMIVLGVGWLGVSLVDAASARTAADAAALAGVVDGQGAAAERAADNGGELVSFRRVGDDVIVTVRCGRATASARATASRAGFSTLGVRDRDQPAG
jgi:hypothetical protein